MCGNNSPPIVITNPDKDIKITQSAVEKTTDDFGKTNEKYILLATITSLITGKKYYVYNDSNFFDENFTIDLTKSLPEQVDDNSNQSQGNQADVDDLSPEKQTITAAGTTATNLQNTNDEAITAAAAMAASLQKANDEAITAAAAMAVSLQNAVTA